MRSSIFLIPDLFTDPRLYQLHNLLIIQFLWRLDPFQHLPLMHHRLQDAIFGLGSGGGDGVLDLG
jgi:hypothetical protein